MDDHDEDFGDSIGDEGGNDALVEEAPPKVKRPGKYLVILHNDDYTTMDFVVEILQRFFQKSETEASDLMLQVHQKGQAVCGIYPYEIAETKVIQVKEYSRSRGFPLKCTVEGE
jgi:ATP-dependent Clp protease adaptor protein ClpS